MSDTDIPSTRKEGSTIVIEIDGRQPISSISFSEDGKEVLTGGSGDNSGMLRRWRVEDGTEIGEAIEEEGVEIYASALSPDRKWMVGGLRRLNLADGRGDARVWDAQTRERVLDIHGHTNTVFSVDISPDSTKFATGSSDRLAFIWNLTTGESLVGPLQHDGVVVAVRFSPSGDRIATAVADVPHAIRIYNSNNGEQLLQISDTPSRVCANPSSWLEWSANSSQLFCVTFDKVKSFNTSLGSVFSTWTIPGGFPASVALSRNQKFVAISTYDLLSFWDTSTHLQLGTIIKHTSPIWGMALSPSDDCIATCEEGGKIVFRRLRDILSDSYITTNVDSQWPLTYISDEVFKPWKQGDLTRVEELLTEEITDPLDPSRHAGALAHRALVRARLKQWNLAIDDAKKSVEVKPSTIGYIAIAISRSGNGEGESAMGVFDRVFGQGTPADTQFLLLIKAIILFEHGKHDDALLRVDCLIDMVADRALYNAARAQMFLLLGGISMKDGDNQHAIELFKRAQEAIPFSQGPCMDTITLMFGWDFDRLALAIQLQLHKAIHAEGYSEVAESPSTCFDILGKEALTSAMAPDFHPDLIQTWLTTLESNGDAAMQSENPEEAIVQYSAAISLNPSRLAGVLVKRSKAQAMKALWVGALRDADEAIKADSVGPWGYERRHAALHGLQRYDEAATAFADMLLLIERSLDGDIRELGNRYVSRSKLEEAVDDVILKLFETHPRVLIDIESGRLCDGPERMKKFKSDLQFKALCSSMTHEVDNGRILHVATEYFEYVMLSHAGYDGGPSSQDVGLDGSVWVLDPSPLNDRLRKFCEVVRTDGYRWAWSGTCCIDRTFDTALKESLAMMYKWYEESAATLVLLASESSPSSHGDLTNSILLGEAWDAAALLIPRVIRFYDCDWKPHLGDTRTNHRESPEIMQELADALGVSCKIVTAFNPDDLTMQEKLRLASTRDATAGEDVHSLMGILKHNTMPTDTNDESDALGRTLREVLSDSGDVTMLSWTGKSSAYNTCLPTTLAVYCQMPYTPPVLEGAEMDLRIAELRTSLSRQRAMLVYERITRLPPARFIDRKVHLPCVVFGVKDIDVNVWGSGRENHYRARVSGIGSVEFHTSEKLSLTEPRKLVFVHPWFHALHDPPGDDGIASESTSDGDESSSDVDLSSSPSRGPLATAKSNKYARAFRLIARLQQPFHALLLQQRDGEFKRVAAEHEIILPGLKHHIKHTRTEVVVIS